MTPSLLDVLEELIRGRESSGKDGISGVRQVRGGIHGPYRFDIQANGPTTVLLLDLNQVPPACVDAIEAPKFLIIREDNGDLVVGFAWCARDVITFYSELDRMVLADPESDVEDRLADALKRADIGIVL